MDNRTLYSLQFLRALAAYLVVAMHSSEAIAVRMTNQPHEYWTLGSIGVDIFFVISGFVMEFLTKDIPSNFLDRWYMAGKFLKKRFVRVVPLYWVYTSFKIILLLLFPFLALRTTFDFQHIVASYFFIPSMAPWGLMQPFLSVGWTLNFEMFFYLIFAIGLLFGCNRVIFALASFLIIDVFAQYFSNDILTYYSQSIVFEFVFGMAIAYAYKRNWLKINPSISLLLILFAITYLLLMTSYFPYSNVLILHCIPAVIIVISMLCLENLLCKNAIFIKISSLGDASYTTYLLHTFVVPVVCVLCIKLGVQSKFLVFLTCLLMTMLLSHLAYNFLEKKMLTLMKRSI